ncbi:MAG: alpha-L-arabinofuranosidase C-terminal domain-containing protein [Bacteroidota bacterium]
MKRRSFLQQSTLAGAGLLFLPPAARSSTSDSRIDILIDEPIAVIQPDIYGHFAEHIGGVVYDGIWVGKNSKIPHINGFRKDLVEHLRRIQPGNLRWPGGCFADSYNWKDGIGPRESRPRRANFWINTPFMQKAPDGPSKYEPNHFGTDEFLQFCELIDTNPYLAANARTLGAQDFVDWVEYCNAPAGTTTFGDMRVTNGHKAPYNVEYWGLGNESWGCGGDMIPEDYAEVFRRFSSFVPRFGADLKFVAVGPSDSWDNRDLQWTQRLFTRLADKSNSWTYIPDRIAGYSLHFYCSTTGKTSLDFTDEDYYEHLWRADQMETIITEHWNVLGAFDQEHKIKLYVDEWGAWHPQKTEVHSTHLFGQTSTMRDAMIAALTLDTFNRHADKVAVANIAQLINNLHSLFLAHEDRFVVTPNFYVFEMYKHHQNGQALRTECSAPSISTERGLWGLQGSASLKGKNLFLTVVNPDVSQARETEISIPSAKVQSATLTSFAQSDIRAYNDLNQANGVKPPQSQELTPRKGALTCTFEPASISSVMMELA